MGHAVLSVKTLVELSLHRIIEQQGRQDGKVMFHKSEKGRGATWRSASELRQLTEYKVTTVVVIRQQITVLIIMTRYVRIIIRRLQAVSHVKY